VYPLPSIIRMMKTRRMKWAEHVVCMWVKRNVYRILVGKPERKRPLRRRDLGEMIILKWMFDSMGWC
jgi:hypothetical protein